MKRILPARLNKDSYERACYAIKWVNKRWTKDDFLLAKLENLPGLGPLSKQDIQYTKYYNNQAHESWDLVVDEWYAIKTGHELQQGIIKIRTWIEKNLALIEQNRLANAMRQARYQKKIQSKKKSSGKALVRIDRKIYDKASSLMPARDKSKIITLLLKLFSEDEQLRNRIIKTKSTA